MTISRTTQLLAIAFASIIINVPAQAQKRGDGSGNKVENDGSGNKTKCQLSLLERLFTSL